MLSGEAWEKVVFLIHMEKQIFSVYFQSPFPIQYLLSYCNKMNWRIMRIQAGFTLRNASGETILTLKKRIVKFIK